MRKLFKKSMPLLMAGLLFFESIIPAFATVTDEHVITSNETVQTEVTYNQESKFEVTVPKLIDLGSDKLTNYTVRVSGDISSDDVVTVVPEESFLMKDISGGENPKADITATVIQDKTSWIFNEFDIRGNGEVSAPDLTSGKWQGTFFFNISMDKEIDNPLVLTIDGKETDSANLGAGDEIQIEATVDGEEATDLVEWESDSSNITVVNGLVETTAAAQVGDMATITATFEMPQTFALRESSKVYTASVTVTVIDIIYTEVGGSEVITEIDIAPGESKEIEATIIPSSATGNITWTTNAISGINLILNGNKVIVKVASDMPIGESYFVSASAGSYMKLIKVNIVPDHNCEYEKTVITAATCTTDGLDLFECIYCDASYENVVKALGHDYKLTKTVDSTCLGEGNNHYECDRCDDYYDEAISAKGHSYDSTKFVVDVEPTCTTTGSKSVHCDVCNVSIAETKVEISALGHTYSNWITTENSTCTATGSQKRTCETCGNTETKDIAALGHTYSSAVTNPTCTAQGYTTHTCLNCGDFYKDTYVAATGHTEEVINGYGATCTETGLADGVKCSVCKVTLTSQTVIPATGHNYSDWTTSLNPTCTVVGSQNRTCSACKEVESKELAAYGHNWESDFTIDKAANCTTDGSKSIHCTRCSTTKDITVIPATGHKSVNGGTSSVHAKCSVCGVTLSVEHSYTSAVTTAATCTTAGVRTYTCGCGYKYTEAIPATGHTSVNAGTKDAHTKCSVCGTTLTTKHTYTDKVTTAATCTTNGVRTYTCGCGYKYTESIPATGHISVNGGTKETHTKCSTCGATLSSTHSYTSAITTNATCTTNGVRTYTCGCGYKYTESIPATGHTSVNGGTQAVHTKCSVCGTTLTTAHTYTDKVTTAATCTTDGVRTYTCNCGYKYTEVINKLGHTYGNWTTSLNPTCTVLGSQNRTCSVCGNKETKDVAVLGHNFSSTFTIDKAATCTTAGSKSKHCSRCSTTTEVTTIPATGHTSVNGGTQAVHTKCSVCGTTLSSTHSYTNKVTTAATCTTAGVRTYTCGCGYKYTEAIAATGHTSINGGTQAVHTKCSVCGVTLSSTHSYTNKVTTAATCTTAGVRTYTCDCNYSYTETIPATGHNMVNGECTICKNMIPGLYDANGALLCTWDESGIDVEKTYTNQSYSNSLTSPKYIITKKYPTTAKVIIPENITTIGDYAFNSCGTLTDIVLPNNLQSIGTCSFDNCKKLTDIVIPDGVTTIGAGAFSRCTNLVNVTIPSTVNRIYSNAFERSPWLETKRAENSLVIVNNILLDASTAKGDVIIPNGITFIGDNAFAFNYDLETVFIPSSVEAIGSRAFAYCESLSKIEFEDYSNWYGGNNRDEFGWAMDFSDSWSNVAYLVHSYNNQFMTKKN